MRLAGDQRHLERRLLAPLAGPGRVRAPPVPLVAGHIEQTVRWSESEVSFAANVDGKVPGRKYPRPWKARTASSPRHRGLQPAPGAVPFPTSATSTATTRIPTISSTTAAVPGLSAHGDDGVQLRWSRRRHFPRTRWRSVSRRTVPGGGAQDGGIWARARCSRTSAATSSVRQQNGWPACRCAEDAAHAGGEGRFQRRHYRIADATWKMGAASYNFKGRRHPPAQRVHFPRARRRYGSTRRSAFAAPWNGSRRGAPEGVYRFNRTWDAGYR